MTEFPWQHRPGPGHLYCIICPERWPCDAEDMRLALGETMIILEALWMAEHDGRLLGPDMKQQIPRVLGIGRGALFRPLKANNDE